MSSKDNRRFWNTLALRENGLRKEVEYFVQPQDWVSYVSSLCSGNEDFPRAEIDCLMADKLMDHSPLEFETRESVEAVKTNFPVKDPK